MRNNFFSKSAIKFKTTGKNSGRQRYLEGFNSGVKRVKEIFGNDTRKTFNRSTTKDSYTSNVTHNMEKCCSLKLEA
jgi:hypothetical protein